MTAIATKFVSEGLGQPGRIVAYNPVSGASVSLPYEANAELFSSCAAAANKYAKNHGLQGKYVSAHLTNPSGYLFTKIDDATDVVSFG
jgi:hypothetical protein